MQAVVRSVFRRFMATTTTTTTTAAAAGTHAAPGLVMGTMAIGPRCSREEGEKILAVCKVAGGGRGGGRLKVVEMIPKNSKVQTAAVREALALAVASPVVVPGYQSHSIRKSAAATLDFKKLALTKILVSARPAHHICDKPL